MGSYNEKIYENLPEILQTLCENFENRERDIVLLSSICVLSGCLPNVKFIYDKKTLATNLYGMIVAPAASGKGVMKHSYELVAEINNKIKRESLEVKRLCEEDKKSKNCPSVSVKVVPGNSSSARLYNYLNSSNHGVIIFETEADSLSNMLKQDWGNFSDVLRNSFHHERLSISRQIDDRIWEIEAPKLSIILSGTGNQLEPLINSVENGLFSRFIYYYFNDSLGWNDNILLSNDESDASEVFKREGQKIFEMYDLLAKRTEPIQFILTQGQKVCLNEKLKYANNDLLLEAGNVTYLANVRRFGVITFRICAILSALRNIDKLNNLSIMTCEESDFQCAMYILMASLNHGIEVQQLFNKKGSVENLSDLSFLKNLPNQFKRGEALIIGEGLGYPVRTIDYKLKMWLSLKILSKIKSGNYKKNKFCQQ